MVRRISILGSTGSIGRSTLDVIREHRDKFKLIGLSCGENIELLAEQVREFEPEIVCVKSKDYAKKLKKLIGNKTEVVFSEEGLIEIARDRGAEIIVNALVGALGLKPAIACISSGKRLALANKESLVMAGEIMMRLAREKGSEVIPVDSEHSALFQLLSGRRKSEVKKLILSASGGPFLGYSLKRLEKVTPEQAIAHPTWSMGKKISVDSATLMNKALEVVEAHFLFGFETDQIEVVIHPQSIVHSLVELVDGAILAQLSVPDMRIPISYALSYPKRMNSGFKALRVSEISKLEFGEVDQRKFPALGLGYFALSKGGTMPIVLNASNEVAVSAFLSRKIKFTDIAKLVRKVMEEHKVEPLEDLSQVFRIDRWARKRVGEMI